MSSIKIVVLGASAVGKSCLVMRYTRNEFFSECDPTVEDSYRKLVLLDEKQHALDILDTAGEEEYCYVGSQYLRKGDGFVLCYNPRSRESFDQLGKYVSAIQTAERSTQYSCILVGTKCDIHEPMIVTEEEGQEFARETCEGGMHFFTSAKEGWGVTEAFEKIASLVVSHKETSGQNARKRKNCIIM